MLGALPPLFHAFFISSCLIKTPGICILLLLLLPVSCIEEDVAVHRQWVLFGVWCGGEQLLTLPGMGNTILHPALEFAG